MKMTYHLSEILLHARTQCTVTVKSTQCRAERGSDAGPSPHPALERPALVWRTGGKLGLSRTVPILQKQGSPGVPFVDLLWLVKKACMDIPQVLIPRECRASTGFAGIMTTREPLRAPRVLRALEWTSQLCKDPELCHWALALIWIYSLESIAFRYFSCVHALLLFIVLPSSLAGIFTSL